MTRSRASQKCPRAPADALDSFWGSRQCNYQTCFEVDSYFRSLDDTTWAIAELERRQLGGLFRPSSTVYPRLVRIFYKNLRRDEDFPHMLSSSIDGHDIRFSGRDIAEILGCCLPRDPDIVYANEAASVTVQEIIDTMCAGRYDDHNQTCTTRTFLPPRLWLVDSIFRRNVNPLGHKLESRGPLLKALFAIHEGFYFDAPSAIMDVFARVLDELVDTQSSFSKKWALPLPNLVCSIVARSGSAISADEPADSTLPAFGRAQRDKSVHAMHAAPTAPVIPPPKVFHPAPPQASSSLCHEDYEHLCSRFDQLRGDVASFQHKFDIFRDRTYASHELFEYTLDNIHEHTTVMSETIEETQTMLRALHLSHFPPPSGPPCGPLLDDDLLQNSLINSLTTQLDLPSENRTVEIDDQLLEESRNHCHFSILGKFVIDRPLNGQFSEERDVLKVLYNQPWCFDGNLLTMQCWELEMEVDEVEMKRILESFTWMQWALTIIQSSYLWSIDLLFIVLSALKQCGSPMKVAGRLYGNGTDLFSYCDMYGDHSGSPHLEEWIKEICISTNTDLETYRDSWDDLELLEVIL
ncbi:hypothetical protein HHK36_024274 [Tetracentron sinense]|uniref:Uncharacterized protein n=1 Tax=Tetracentron sinense TaxID=13715 RepID=A0A834YKP7_TETSI|nr:hypothetical protein HHK36_024274 [Tetracentron sinense]